MEKVLGSQKAETQKEFGSLRTDMEKFRTDMEKGFGSIKYWFLMTVGGLVASLVGFLHMKHLF